MNLSRLLLVLAVAAVTVFGGKTRVEAQPSATQKATQGEHNAAWVIYAGTLIDGASDEPRANVSMRCSNAALAWDVTSRPAPTAAP